MSNQSASDESFDLTQFYGIFFEEAAEHLDSMEALLLGIDIAAADDEQLNAIFRAAHSIKGGAATFGFKDITELTHEMETVFDLVRKGKMALTTDLVDAFLASGDMLKSMLSARREGGSGLEGPSVQALCQRLKNFLEGKALPQSGATPTAAAADAAAGHALPAAPPAAPPAPATKRILEIVFGPFDKNFSRESVDSVVADLHGFGNLVEIEAPAPCLPEKRVAAAKGKSKATAAKTAAAAKTQAKPVSATPQKERRFRLETEVSAADLNDAIGFMADPDYVKVICIEEIAPPAVLAQVERQSAAQIIEAPPAPIRPESNTESIAAPETQSTEASAALPGAAAEDGDFGFFVDPISVPANHEQAQDAKPSNDKIVNIKTAKPAEAAKPQAAGESASIRVGVEKVDQLINLVGELVITQAILAQSASKADPALYEALLNSVTTLQRNTRDIQEAVMSIRMMPMSFAFSRFPRVVRDTAAKLGKEVELQTLGEGTELDKGLIERIVDPLTHLVRNSLDHGLESPDERLSCGKTRKGTITLRAFHQGGVIVIEVSDDGRGLRRDKILGKARERGMDVSDAMSDAEVWNLIFEAGFSTAETVTDVSGRGVGMDVVRRNIQEMGGRVDIESVAGIGTRIAIRLPLTLAILDGMSIKVAEQTFIIPLGCISESLQPDKSALSSVNGRGRVIAVRGEYLPVLELSEFLGIRGEKRRIEDGILVIVESEGGKTALFVDDLVGQHQVVIKSLETNYRKVPGISGATIMGDGRVAMILDIDQIVGASRGRLAA